MRLMGPARNCTFNTHNRVQTSTAAVTDQRAREVAHTMACCWLSLGSVGKQRASLPWVNFMECQYGEGRWGLTESDNERVQPVESLEPQIDLNGLILWLPGTQKTT